jgi:hypothetical protein
MSAQTGREATFVALFAKLQKIAGVQTVSRAWRSPADVSPNEQPAIFLVQGPQSATTGYRQPIRWTGWRGEFAIYTHSESRAGILASTQLNTLLDAVEAAVFRPDIDGAATLGGLVSHLGIDGDVEIHEGNLGVQAVAVIPFVIVPNS